MIIRFSNTKAHLLFIHESSKEASTLGKFPGLMKVDLCDGCPAILPVAYNLIERLKKVMPIKLTIEVQTWLSTEFKLLPLPSSFKYHTNPKDFQDIALRFIYTLGSAGLLLDPGMGKTKVVLDYIFLKGFKLSLVACPSALLFVWEDEVKIHRPELVTYVVKSTDWDTELINIESLVKTGKQIVLVINYTKVSILKHRIKDLEIEYLHLDEFLIKDPSTTRTVTMLQLSKKIPYKSGGSGTLINNSPLDEFSPIRFLQPSLVGYNYSTFMERYCVMKESMVGPPGNQKKTRKPVAYRYLPEMRSILDSCCIVMTKEKWLKLPPKHFHDIYVQMSPEQKESYYGLMRNYYVNIQGYDIKADNPLVMLSKLYQISQGFVYVGEEKENSLLEDLLAEPIAKKPSPRQTLFFPESPKITALEKLLTETLNGKKAIIWFNMNAEFVLIKELLDRLGHKYLSIQGGDKKIGEKVRTFNSTPEIPWLVCQSKSVNYGITVLGSNSEALEKDGIEVLPNIDPSVYSEVFLSMNFSLEVYSQQQDRIHRLGQERDCHYYRIFCNNPVESRIRQAIAEKMDIRKDMLVDISLSMLQDSGSIESISPIQ